MGPQTIKLLFYGPYSCYNHIKMDLVDTPKTTFMSNHGKYYYNVMSFGLKNASSTYQRLIDIVF